MNRIEFMSALDARLKALDEEDRNDALRYYDELFDEAGPLEEQKILDDLGDPQDIARQILADNGISPDGRPEFMIDDVIRAGNGTNANNNNSSAYGTYKQKDLFTSIKESFMGLSRNTRIVVIVAILIVTSPVWGGILSGVLGFIFGLIGLILGLVIAFTAAGVGLIISGFVYLFRAPPLGLVILGIGLIVTALDILLIFPLVKWAFGLLVKFIRWVVDTIKSLVNKRANA